MLHAPSLVLLDLITLIFVEVMKLLILLSSLVSHHFLPLKSKYSPQHPVSNTLISLTVRDQVPHSYN